MQASSLLLAPDRSMGLISFHDMPDQAMMEMLVSQIHELSSQNFKKANGDYRNVCQWPGVWCNRKRRIVKIKWEDNPLRQCPVSGTLDLRYIPPRTLFFGIDFAEKYSKRALMGTIDASTLPESLEALIVPFQRFHGIIDFRRLPPNLLYINLQSNRVTGSLHITSLPKGFIKLMVDEGSYPGSLPLTRLPQTLTEISASDCKISGSLNLLHLPPVFEVLILASNALSGSVSFDRLPLTTMHIMLPMNKLCGSFVLLHPPPLLNTFDVSFNRFRGTAVVHHRAISIVTLNANRIRALVDENGEKSKEREIWAW